jgi:hypothetical protein
VYEPTTADVAAWQAATAPLYDEAKEIVGGTWVADAVAFREDWDAGKFKAEEQRYIAQYAKIAVPVDEVMKNFK